MLIAGICGLLALLAGLWWFTRAPQRLAPQSGNPVHGAVVVWSPAYRVSFFGLERLHPFQLDKSERAAERLVTSGLMTRGDFAVPAPVDDVEMGRVHDPAYLAGLTDPAALSRALEVTVPSVFGASTIESRLLYPFRLQVGGTVVAGRGAMQHGLGINLGGGFHHARPEMGHGFCVYSDVAVAIDALRRDGVTGTILVVDTDAHQGDGTHAFYADDPTVFSFSMHQAGIFPIPKLKGDLDIELPAGTGDAAFLEQLEAALAEIIAEQKPVLVIHVAGADVLGDDPLAGLQLTPEGLVARDLAVYRAARAGDAALLHVLAGGYGPSAAAAQAEGVLQLLQAHDPAP